MTGIARPCRTVPLWTLVFLVFACGAKVDPDRGPLGVSGLPRSQVLSTFTTEDLAKFCDWDASLMGGYHSEKVCGPGDVVTNWEDKAQCMRLRYKGPCTVADAERCETAWYADVCTSEKSWPEGCEELHACSLP
jgi:hypothetical protein